MGKRFSFAVALGALMVALSAAPASAAGELDSCLQGDALICQVEGASIGNSSSVEAALQGTGVKVAVVPDSDSVSASLQASQIATNNGVGELILVIDGTDSDSFGVYSASGKTADVSEALYGAGASDGGDAIASVDLSSIYRVSSGGSEASGSSGGGTVSIVFGLLLFFAALGAGTTLVIRAIRNRTQTALDGNPTKAAIAVQKTVDLSDDLREELSGLARTIESYGRDSEPQLREAAALLRPIHGHTYELFARIDKKNSSQNRELARVRYLSILQKLNSTLSKDYFEDIVRNPDLWEDSSKKVSAVLAALSSVDRQIIENIKQVNSSKELQFLVKVESLTGSEATSVEEAFGETAESMDKRTRGNFLR